MTRLGHSTAQCFAGTAAPHHTHLTPPVQTVFCKHETQKDDVLVPTVAHPLCLLQVTELQEQLQGRDKQMQGVVQQHTAHSSALSQERQQLLDQASSPPRAWVDSMHCLHVATPW